ncbi:MAG: hypothetical protein QOF69_84 [Solirubrobacteraceae bacterium]|jgi:hypothetical protein|nr:hypothetical protein [Solirubrobacteraceae bacterium]
MPVWAWSGGDKVARSQRHQPWSVQLSEVAPVVLVVALHAIHDGGDEVPVLSGSAQVINLSGQSENGVAHDSWPPALGSLHDKQAARDPFVERGDADY